MRLGVLCSEESWYFRDLRRAAGADDQLLPLAFERLAARLGPETPAFRAAEQELLEPDAILVRTMPPGTLEQVVFRMDILARLESQGQLVINPPRAIEAAVDKYLALAKLQQAGLPVPRTCTCQTAADALAGFESLGGDAVVKPLFGSEGRGIVRVSDPALAERAFRMLARMGAVIYLQQFIQHEGYDLRILVIGRETFAVHRSHPHDWRTNVARGATCQKATPSDRERELALEAARVIGAPLAGVDLLRGRDGQQYVIEVNAVPGWKALAAAHHEDISRRVLDFVRNETCRITNPT